MTDRRRWTYAEITGAAEEEIVFWMNQAATHARAGRPGLDDYGQGAARGAATKTKTTLRGSKL